MSSPPRSIYSIPPYPQDSRATRVYAGPVRKWDSRKAQVSAMYGPRNDEIELFTDLRARYEGCHCPTALSPRDRSDPASYDMRVHGEVLDSPWVEDNFEARRQVILFEWYITLASIHKETEQITGEKARPFLPWSVSPKADLQLLPTSVPEQLQGAIFAPGDSAAYNDDEMLASGHSLRSSQEEYKGKMPVLNKYNATPPENFVFNTGGKVLSLEWEPLPDADGPQYSFLAIAVVPHDDRGSDTNSSDAMMVDYEVQSKEKTGSVQIWRLPLKREGHPLPEADLLPLLSRVYCIPGRPRRVKWCPVKPNDPAMAGLLAWLSDDGVLRVFRVPRKNTHETKYEHVIQPLATLNYPGEPTILATCMAWAVGHIIYVGYSDGSVAMWNLVPTRVTLRIAAHNSAVQDICTGHHSLPMHVVSRPVEGCLRLLDFRRASSEHTFHPNPVAGIRNNLLDWSEHMQGFVSATPFNGPLNTSLEFLHHRHFPVSRKLFPSTREGPPTCLSAGKLHPFVLIGSSDGKVRIVNLMDALFPTANGSEGTQLVLSSEFRSPPEPEPEPEPETADDQGRDSTLFGGLTYSTWPNGTHLNTTTSKGKEAAAVPANDNSDDEGETVEGEGEGSLGIVIHEGPTAVTSVSWHPNLDFATWSAIGFASGLVMVKNLALK